MYSMTVVCTLIGEVDEIGVDVALTSRIHENNQNNGLQNIHTLLYLL